ncbi:MAG: sugar phosphate isomerase/epimerase family protein [Tepidisphaeraceae bacterium]
MPRFGVCTSVDHAAVMKAGGWDFVEENVQTFLQGLAPDVQWTNDAKAKASPLPIPCAALLVPGSLKITGPSVDVAALTKYIGTVAARAQTCGLRKLVFGSGGARNVPEGWSRDEAREQVLAFLRMATPIAQRHSVTLVVEPLNRKECNIVNTVAEAMTYVREVDHPNVRCLVDSYHLWLEDEPLSNVKEAMPAIRHVHLADKDGRVAPGESGMSDYRPLFRVLKEGGYDAEVSVEAVNFDIPKDGRRVLEFLKKQWSDA